MRRALLIVLAAIAAIILAPVAIHFAALIFNAIWLTFVVVALACAAVSPFAAALNRDTRRAPTHPDQAILRPRPGS